MGKEIKLPHIPDEEQTPLVKGLLGIIEQLNERIQRQEEEIGHLKEEIAVFKGEKKGPRFKPSKLDQEAGKDTQEKEKAGKGKRWATPDGRTLIGRLPTALQGAISGPLWSAVFMPSLWRFSL